MTDEERMSRDIRQEEGTEAADLDLPASQRPAGVGGGVGFRARGNPAFLQGELALHSRLVQEDGRDKLGLVRQPVAVLKLERRTGGWRDVRPLIFSKNQSINKDMNK